MSVIVAEEKEIRRIVREENSEMEHRLLHAINQIGKPRRMTLQECADEWGVIKRTASKRLKKLYANGVIENVDFDSQPITVNRKEFFEAI